MTPDHAPPGVHKPIAVFDAGIGSYSAVAAIRNRFPQQDIIYLADRASFPYGAKSLAELRVIISRTLDYLETLSVAAVVVASNVPSATILSDVAAGRSVPVIGVLPPVREALYAADGGDVLVLGARSLVTSDALRSYIRTQAGSDAARVHPHDASNLIDLVETGLFLFDRQRTREAVDAFLHDALARTPHVKAVTLSSTHLPWLRGYLTAACPTMCLLDPLDDVIARLGNVTTVGTGTTTGLVTQTAKYPVNRFSAMLARLDIHIPLTVVRLDSSLPPASS